ncbi:MAG: hypothetical protein Kow00122_16090 [Thermoleophilia bacterium]
MTRGCDVLVQVHVRLMNHTRGKVKPMGCHTTKCSSTSFVARALSDVSQELARAAAPTTSACRGGHLVTLSRDFAPAARSDRPRSPRRAPPGRAVARVGIFGAR